MHAFVFGISFLFGKGDTQTALSNLSVECLDCGLVTYIYICIEIYEKKGLSGLYCFVE